MECEVKMRKRWTEDHTQKLTTLANSNLSFAEIARRIGMSQTEIYRRAQKLGYDTSFKKIQKSY